MPDEITRTLDFVKQTEPGGPAAYRYAAFPSVDEDLTVFVGERTWQLLNRPESLRMTLAVSTDG
jgi:hypothetical protein